MEWLWRLGVLSNKQAVANARAATTELSRQRVVRVEVELYLRDRYADLPARTAFVALDAPAVEVAR
jgi:hypothetical protein